MRIKFNPQFKQKGISLIELVIFIVIMSVALTGITLIYINTTRYSADPMMRIRSIELAQSTLEEILLKAYDGNTPIGGGCVQLSNVATTLCTSGINPASDPDDLLKPLGTDGETSRGLYDDVDDYHNKLYCGASVVAANTACPTLSCTTLQDESGTDISAQYSGFSVCITLSYAGGAGSKIDNVAMTTGSKTVVATNDAKRIDVIVTDPLNSRIALSAYRLNY